MDQLSQKLPLIHDFSRRFRRRLKTLAWLIPILTVAFTSATLLRFDFQLSIDQWTELAVALPLVLVVKTLAFALGRLGRIWHAFVSLHDAIRLARMTVMATLAVAACDYFASGPVVLPRGVILIDCCLTAILIGGSLTLRRVIREHRERDRRADRDEQSPVVIAGSAVAAEVFLRALRNGNQSNFKPVAMVTDRERMLHSEISGVPILGLVEETAAVAARVQAATVLLISGALPGNKVRSIVEQCEEAGIDVQVVPEVTRIVNGHVDFQPRSVAIEDLLGRESVRLDAEPLREWVKGRTVLVTGSCGSIGSELSRQLLALEPARLLLMDRSETGQFFLERELESAVASGRIEILVADATDRARMASLFEQYAPEIVFHAAAYKHVPLMEQHPGEAVKNIIGATRNLADLAKQHNVESFVMVSTDKAVNPTSVMGCCKRVAELYVQSLNHSLTGNTDSVNDEELSRCRFVTVRFGNVLGSAGSVIPVFRKQIAAGGPVTITHPDMTRFFMTIPEASQLVIQAGCVGEGGEIFVLDMGEPVRIIDLATDMVRLSGLRLGVDLELKISGLRPGEKLYEELYAEDETRRATEYAKILVADSVTMPRLEILRHVTRLMNVAEIGGDSVRDQLKMVVPSYRHERSAKKATESTSQVA